MCCAKMAKLIEVLLECRVGWVQGTCITWECRCRHGKGHCWDVW